ncbi:discoidin domain-containing protein [Oerskovia sp. M15]
MDGDPGTKWLAFETAATITLRLDEPVALARYTLTSANDFDGRDPKSWTLQGSTDGTTWHDVDARSDEDFPQRFQPRDFDVESGTAYGWYRLRITQNGARAPPSSPRSRSSGPTPSISRNPSFPSSSARSTSSTDSTCHGLLAPHVGPRGQVAGLG